MASSTDILRPLSKDGAAEKAAGQRWAVDTSMRPNGQEPIFLQAAKYYVNLS
jgi:hypothetical protein